MYHHKQVEPLAVDAVITTVETGWYRFTNGGESLEASSDGIVFAPSRDAARQWWTMERFTDPAAGLTVGD